MDLLESIYYVVSDPLLLEMANLQSKTTGLEHTIHVCSKGGAQHGPKVKVSNVAGKFDKDDNFTVTLEAESRVVGSCKIKKEHLDNVKDWIKLNSDHLNKVWHDDGKMDIDDVSDGFKKL